MYRSCAMLAVLVLCCCSATSPFQAQELTPQKKAQRLTRAQLIGLLHEEIDTRRLPRELWFPDIPGALARVVKAQKKKVMPICIDPAAYHEGSLGAVDCCLVKTVVSPRLAPVGQVLANYLKQARSGSGRPCSYLLRRGEIVITIPADPALRVESLLDQGVLGRYEKKPLAEVLEDLADQTGVNIVIDSRLGEKAKVPVTASFAHETSLRAALKLVADMAHLQFLEVDDALYITSVETSGPLLEERQRQHRLRLGLGFQPQGFGYNPSLIPGLGFSGRP